MNILQALQQLRDDIKAWVTKNFEAVDEKIDKKTFPIDSRLDSSSTNPVQNKVVTTAINNIPRFSGDYNDLTNAPDITEDDSGEIAVTDPDGNVIFKIDSEGAHTTALSLSGELAATESYVDEAIKAIPTPNVSGQIGVHNSSETAHEDIRKAIVDTKEELSETIESKSETWKITDDNGNTILAVDESGLNTTTVTAQTVLVNGSDVEDHILELNIHITAEERETWNKKSDFSGSYNDLTDVPIAADLSNYYTKDEVDEAIENVEVDLTGYATEGYVDTKVADLVNSAPEALNTLGELATALENHEDAYDALLEIVGGKVDKVDGKGLSTNDFTNEYKNKLDNLDDIVVEESDPTVPAWAKEATKPTYTAEEVGALPEDTLLFSGDYNDLTNAPDLSDYYTKGEVDEIIENIDIPVAVEAITNDEIDEICEMTLEDFLDTLAVEEVPF